MEPGFITYQKFDDPVLANELAEQLDKHHIKYYVAEESQTVNPLFALNKEISIEYSVKINANDFEQVNQLLKDDESEDVTEVAKDYYLFSFTDDELMEVITKADEWSAFDFVLARKILTERGKEISDQAISAINDKRIEELKAPDPPQTFWIVIGYFFAFLGGVLGVFIGWHLMTYKKTLPDGERVFGYTEKDRKQGKRIFYIAIAVVALCIIIRLTVAFNND